MLSQANIDTLMQTIQSDEPAYVYYVAHMIEGRETDVLDEHSYKDVSKFKVVKVQVENIENAYFEYLNYTNNPDNYHIEEEEYYYHASAKYIQCFVTPNGQDSYSKDINARMPSIIYGYNRKVFDHKGIFKEVKDPSPVKVIFTNALEYGAKSNSEVINDIDSGKLDWKYRKLDSPEVVDGIEYNYITSDWYILTLKNYPMIEKPLINVRQHSGYFIDIQDAFRYIEQLIA
jgi:hypothetical protein